MISLTGCKSTETASGNEARSAPPASSNAGSSDNSNRSTQAEARNDNSAVATSKDVSAPQEKADSSPQLVGTYEAREIQEKGIVTLVSKIKTVISFSPEGTYSRVSQAGGQTYHSDSGLFRIEKPDKLVLTIQLSREKSIPKIQSPPLRRIHIFSLSPDGEELKLTSGKGTVAVFRRIAKPKSS